MKFDIFPEVFPDDLCEKIIMDGADHNHYDVVYRISNSGKIEKDTFRSSFEEKLFVNRDMEKAKTTNESEIGIYSTSFLKNLSDAKSTLKLLKKHNNKAPCLIVGSIKKCFGLSMMTRNSKTGRKCGKKSHIDLWKYEPIDPSPVFVYLEES